MKIDAQTKIATLLKHHPQALDAIVAIAPAFQKLRNPLLRKLMAGRTTIAMAAKIGGCRVDDFYRKLQPLGFVAGSERETEEKEQTLPLFMQTLEKDRLVELDVRATIAAGNDPLNQILQKVKTLQPEQVLKVINTFEPTPLMLLLQKKGFEAYADAVQPNLVETYFHQKENRTFEAIQTSAENSSDWESSLQLYQNNVETIDVRHLPMPQPMHTILEALEKLPQHRALLVYHKRIPVYLLPELSELGFDIRIKEGNESEVHLLIFRKQK